jgi:hypothetical protein
MTSFTRASSQKSPPSPIHAGAVAVFTHHEYLCPIEYEKAKTNHCTLNTQDETQLKPYRNTQNTKLNVDFALRP